MRRNEIGAISTQTTAFQSRQWNDSLIRMKSTATQLSPADSTNSITEDDQSIISTPTTIEPEPPFLTPSEDKQSFLESLPHDKNNDNIILAAIAASSSSSLPLQGIDDFDTNSPSFLLLASLRSQITDLSSQVSSLNSKLVKSYDRIGDLEDDLHETTTKQTQIQSTVESLTNEKNTWEAQIEGGGWVERVSHSLSLARITDSLILHRITFKEKCKD